MRKIQNNKNPHELQYKCPERVMLINLVVLMIIQDSQEIQLKRKGLLWILPLSMLIDRACSHRSESLEWLVTSRGHSGRH